MSVVATLKNSGPHGEDMLAADAAAGMFTKKRKVEDGDASAEPEYKVFKKADSPPQTTGPPQTSVSTKPVDDVNEGSGSASLGSSNPMTTKVKEVRLEQNRKAARESRRRKKVMIEELQRSVIFFSRANGSLKQQNEELTRLVMQAQTYIAAKEPGDASVQPIKVEEKSCAEPAPAVTTGIKTDDSQQAQAQAVAARAVLMSQGFPAAAARAAAQTMHAVSTPSSVKEPIKTLNSSVTAPLPSMQPGSTMQAMANFQQAAAAAMQSAIQGLQGIPGFAPSLLSVAPAGNNAQQAYTDAMTAFAMHQAAAAAAAAAGQHFAFMPHAMMAWQQQAMSAAAAAAAAASSPDAVPVTAPPQSVALTKEPASTSVASEKTSTPTPAAAS